MEPNFTALARVIAAIDQAIIDYRHMTHDTVVIEQVEVLGCQPITPALVSWHIEVEGTLILVWDHNESHPLKAVAQEVAA